MFLKEFAKKIIGYRRWHTIQKLIPANKEIYNGKVPYQDWINIFHKYTILAAYRSDLIEEMVTAFFSTAIETIKISGGAQYLAETEPILICLEKNDLARVKALVMHYKNMGIKHMVFIDNASTDGTMEWLLQLEGIDIYSVHDKYTTARREAWINRILAMYGYDRWYIVVDSDEFLVYKDMEKSNISAIVSYCNENHLKTVRGLMLDMYADGRAFADKEIADFIQHCRFFDCDGYYEVSNKFFKIIKGGVRERAMGTDAVLTKYPLFYFEKGVFEESSHYRFPYERNFTAPCLFGILHYKFIDQKDIEKIQQRVRDKNYANGSEQYKGYLSAYIKNRDISLMYEGTKEYIDSSTLDNIIWIENWAKGNCK